MERRTKQQTSSGACVAHRLKTPAYDLQGQATYFLEGNKMNHTKISKILAVLFVIALTTVFLPLWAAADTFSLTPNKNMTPEGIGTKKSVTDSLVLLSSDTSYQRNGSDQAFFTYRYKGQASAEGNGSGAGTTGYLGFSFSLTPAVWEIYADIDYSGVVAVSSSSGEAGISDLVLSSTGSASGLSHTLTGAGRNTSGGTTFDRTTGHWPPAIATAETGSGSVRLTLEYGAQCSGTGEAYASLGQMSPLSAFNLDDTAYDSSDMMLVTLTFTPSLNFTGQTANWDLVMASGETLTGYGTINGDVSMHAEGTLNVKIGGPDLGQYDHFDFYGDVDLAGTLRVELLPGFVPEMGQVFRIMNSHAVTTGTFELLDLQPLGPGLFWDTSKLYTDGEIMVSIICPSPVIGDLNNDCKVDFSDLAVFSSHWLECNYALEEDCW